MSKEIHLVQTGMTVLPDNNNTANAATVWFGKYDNDQPASWRVIGYGGDGIASESETMTLLASGVMGNTKFTNQNNNDYSNSLLKEAVDTLA